jgi:hypothetical protein
MKMREGITTTDARGRSIKQSLVKRAYLRLASTNWPETGMWEVSQNQLSLLLLVFRSREPQLHARDCVCLLIGIVWDKLAIFLLTTSAEASSALRSELSSATGSTRAIPCRSTMLGRDSDTSPNCIDSAATTRNGQDCTFIAQNGANDTNQHGSNSVIRCALRLDNVGSCCSCFARNPG